MCVDCDCIRIPCLTQYPNINRTLWRDYINTWGWNRNLPPQAVTACETKSRMESLRSHVYQPCRRASIEYSFVTGPEEDIRGPNTIETWPFCAKAPPLPPHTHTHTTRLNSSLSTFNGRCRGWLGALVSVVSYPGRMGMRLKVTLIIGNSITTAHSSSSVRGWLQGTFWVHLIITLSGL